MFDILLRPLKDKLFDSIVLFVPSFIEPSVVTLLAFLAGTQACFYAASNNTTLSLTLWALNRALDCLDGALARKRNKTSDLGGFFDLLSDFIIYSAIPIACARSHPDPQPSTLWPAVAVLEAIFHINNFVLFYVAAIIEKQKAIEQDGWKVKELTSVAMKPALVEGTESAVFFTLMLLDPGSLQSLAWCMSLLVSIGIVQRVWWVTRALKSRRE